MKYKDLDDFRMYCDAARYIGILFVIIRISGDDYGRLTGYLGIIGAVLVLISGAGIIWSYIIEDARNKSRRRVESELRRND